jgi:hypothetical protein
MSDKCTPSPQTRRIIADLAAVPRVVSLGPIAARFVHSLRLIALHDRARRDPIPELATRLASVEAAAKTLALAQSITASWPERLHVSRFCCCAMTHDETTVGALIDAASSRDRSRFDAAVQGLVRPAGIELLWDAALDLVAAELRAA